MIVEQQWSHIGKAQSCLTQGERLWYTLRCRFQTLYFKHFRFMKGKDAVAEIGASAMMDMDKLSKWLADSRIDPNDPANSELVFLLRVSFIHWYFAVLCFHLFIHDLGTDSV